MKFKSTAILNVLVLMGVSTFTIAAGALECRYVAGKVTLTPDPTCKIASQYSGPPYLLAPGTCFSVTLKGTLNGTGYSGLTRETLISPLTPSAGSAPAILNESGLASAPNEFGLPETRRFFTARSVLSLPGGRVFTADGGIIDGLISVEQLVVTKGDGNYAGAAGTFNAGGNIFAGGWLFGELCSVDND